LIEAEALEALEREHGISLAAHEARRNVVTRGISLDDLVGRRFRVGEVECVAVELCEPCSHLASLTHPAVLRGLVHRGGLRADVMRGGSIAVGDEVAPL
jgi:MOSC domain-containing protein YiiM